jgi:transposase/TolB-like protein
VTKLRDTVRTVSGRGYMLSGWREGRSEGQLVPVTSAESPGELRAAPGRIPLVAVLPFHDPSEGADDGYFAEGVVDDIIVALGRFREFGVIARNSSHAYAGRSVDIRQVARELGVTYVLDVFRRGMKGVDTIARVRREFHQRKRSIKQIARELHISRNTVRKILRSDATAFSYERERQPLPKIGPWKGELDRILFANEGKAARERLTLIRIYEELQGLGFAGGYDAVRRYARSWDRERGAMTAEAFVPLVFAPGEAYQFDWSHEVVLINNVTVTVKIAHVRLCHSRMFFLRAYPRETQEMVFDAHDRAFAFFRGTCQRGIYDNMKTAVDTVFVGKDRGYNRRFLQMCSHYLIDPTACTPAAGWEKGQVENQVGLVRERFFTPRLRVKSYAELNDFLMDRCVAYARAHKHPELADRTIWEVFEDERPRLVPLRGTFDSFHATTASVSRTCLVRFDNNL